VVGFAGGQIEKVRVEPCELGPEVTNQVVQLPLNLVLLKNVSIIGIFWGSYASANTSLVSLFLPIN
jgi:hypothetical protein